MVVKRNTGTVLHMVQAIATGYNNRIVERGIFYAVRAKDI
jgi:hypothetical protein